MSDNAVIMNQRHLEMMEKYCHLNFEVLRPIIFRTKKWIGYTFAKMYAKKAIAERHLKIVESDYEDVIVKMLMAHTNYNKTGNPEYFNIFNNIHKVLAADIDSGDFEYRIKKDIMAMVA